VGGAISPSACLRGALTDPNRELPGDLTVGELCGEEFARLAADIDEALAIGARTEERRGFPYVLLIHAARRRSAASPIGVGGEIRTGSTRRPF
jgi:hypothetical protein